MIEIILIREICKDASKKLVNNEGKNHVCLYNYFNCIYMSINKTLIHLPVSKKKLDDLFEYICFCYSRLSCCQKYMVTTKDQYRKYRTTALGFTLNSVLQKFLITLSYHSFTKPSSLWYVGIFG